jgi:hypothetical protein
MSDSILSPAFLFRFAVPCRYAASMWPQRGAAALGADHALPSFGQWEGRRLFATLRIGWNELGIGCDLRVQGKSAQPWCRANRVEDSDGLWIWLDTRNTQGVHRANRFCHRFAFLPEGGGSRFDEPVGLWMPIHRARENSKPIHREQLALTSTCSAGGYSLRSFIPADALTGFDASEHPKLGFSYAVVDRELGWQTFSVGPEFPFGEDPSLWGTLELVRDQRGASMTENGDKK